MKKQFITILIVSAILFSFLHFVAVSYATDLWINNTGAFYTTDPVYTGGTIRAGQLINVPSKTIIIVSFYLTKSGSPTGYAYCVIRKASTDAVLANSSALDVSTIPTYTTKAWFNFTIITPPVLNEDVRIQFEFGGGSGSSYPAMCLSQPAIDGNYTHYVSSYTNYSQFDMIMQIYTGVEDTASPTYSSVSTNTTGAGEPCKFSCLWADETALSGYIFGTNNTGTFTNETWTSLSGVSAWANVTKTLIASIATIQFEWWANDTANNWNNTGIQSFITTGRSVTFYINYFGLGEPRGFINYNGTLICDIGDGLNGTSMIFSNVTTTLRLEAFNGPSSYGNIFEWFYINGTKISSSDPTPSKSGNPYNLLVNNSYVVIANFTQRQNACANFTISPQTAGINDTITFDPSLSYIIERTITLYTWDFGDGNVSTTDYLHPSITHKYVTTNLFNVTLTISDVPYSDTDSLIKSVSITEDTSWYIAPGFILGFVCFLGVGFVLIKKKHD